MKLHVFSWALIVSLLVSRPSCAGVVSLVPAKDTTIIQGTSPTGQLANGRGDLFSGRTNQDGQAAPTISIRRSLINFNIAAAIPSWATVTGVQLRMRDVMGLNGDNLTTLHRVQQNWSEGNSFQSGGMGSAATLDDATWLYTFFKPATPTLSPAWTNPGGDYDAAASGSAIVSDDLGGGQFFTWLGTGMISDVQNWLDHPATNFGWLIHGDESRGQTAKRLDGRTTVIPVDVTVPNPNAPVLTVTFVPEPGTAALVAFVVGSVLATWRSRILN